MGYEPNTTVPIPSGDYETNKATIVDIIRDSWIYIKSEKQGRELADLLGRYFPHLEHSMLFPIEDAYLPFWVKIGSSGQWGAELIPAQNTVAITGKIIISGELKQYLKRCKSKEIDNRIEQYLRKGLIWALETQQCDNKGRCLSTERSKIVVPLTNEVINIFSIIEEE